MPAGCAGTYPGTDGGLGRKREGAPPASVGGGCGHCMCRGVGNGGVRPNRGLAQPRVDACGCESPRGADSVRSSRSGELQALCVCVCVSARLCVYVCVSGPVAQSWSRSAPTGMWLLSAPRTAPAPHGSGRQESRREGKRGRGGESTEPAIRRAQTQHQTKDSSCHPFPGEAGGEAKPGSLRPPPEPRECTQAGRGAGVFLPVCAGTEGTGASPRPGVLPEGLTAVDSECSSRPRPRHGEPRRGHFLSSLREGCQASPDLPNTNPIWEEEKLSRERDRHGNRAELTRLAWRGERCLVQRPQCEFPYRHAACRHSAFPGLFLRCPPGPSRPRQITVTQQPRGSSSKKGVAGPTWEIDFHLLCPNLSTNGSDLQEGRISYCRLNACLEGNEEKSGRK